MHVTTQLRRFTSPEFDSMLKHELTCLVKSGKIDKLAEDQWGISGPREEK